MVLLVYGLLTTRTEFVKAGPQSTSQHIVTTDGQTLGHMHQESSGVSAWTGPFQGGGIVLEEPHETLGLRQQQQLQLWGSSGMAPYMGPGPRELSLV